MHALSKNQQFSVVGGLSSALIIAAGAIALTGAQGVLYAAIILTLTLVIAIVGTAYAKNHELGWGVAALIAAALPLAYPLYAIGATILKHLGPGVAGGLLIALGAIVGCGAAWLAFKSHARSDAAALSRVRR